MNKNMGFFKRRPPLYMTRIPNYEWFLLLTTKIVHFTCYCFDAHGLTKLFDKNISIGNYQDFKKE